MSIFDDLAKGRFLGHPIHMMLVHFPAALFPFGFLADAASLFTGDASFGAAACYAYAAGVILGSAAAIFGAVDYFRLPTDRPAWTPATVHALLNLLWLSVFTFLCGLRITSYPHIGLPTLAGVLVSGIAVLGMIVSNHLGGELVIRHGVGTSLGQDH